MIAKLKKNRAKQSNFEIHITHTKNKKQKHKKQKSKIKNKTQKNSTKKIFFSVDKTFQTAIQTYKHIKK